MNVDICIVLLHLSGFCLILSSIAYAFEIWGQGSKLSRIRPFYTLAKSDAVWPGVLSMGHGNLSMAVFLLSYIESTLVNEQ